MSEPKIGVDQWVEQYAQRASQKRGLPGLLERASQRLPAWAWIIVLVALASSLPFLTSNTFAIRVAGNVALLATLALGLNIVVGYAGLLDLGYVAFYGVGAYTYAYLSSGFTGVHLPTPLTLVIVVLVSGFFGFLLGLPSLRLIGDYLAIVTLGFGLVFEQLMTSLTRVSLPGREGTLNLTGGPNGIPNLDPFSLAGFSARGVVDYYYIALLLLAVVMLVVYHLYRSRIGRAWSALREDELAAEVMGMPTQRLKIQAFTAGAAIAGLCGAVFAAWQGSVFPGNFSTTLLITVYAIIVLGGLGSIPGVLLGSLVIVAVPDVLRNAELAGTLFYGTLLLALVAMLKPRWQAPALLAAVVIFGFALRALLLAIAPEFFAPLTTAGSPFSQTIREWLIIPQNYVHYGNLAFVALIALIMAVSKMGKPLRRLLVLIPTIYLLIFAWETRLSQEPSITRLIFVGVLLVVLMIYRPNGLLGQRRVEVV